MAGQVGGSQPWIFDFDNHYYEAEDAFTRYQDRSLGNRGVRWANVDGRRRLLVGGTINSYVANPTFDPVSKPGALYEWYRGNPNRHSIREAFGELEPIRPEYRDREVRLKVMLDQGLAGMLLFPTLGVGLEGALRDDPEAAAAVFSAFNRWLADDWGYRYEGRIFAVPYVPLLDPAAAASMASVENGASWVPDLLHRLDDAANRNPGYFQDAPRDVFGEHVWVTPFWEDSVSELTADIRLDRLLLGSDWPHAEGTRQPADFVTESLAGFAPEQIRRIGRDNALDLLGITLP